MAACVVVKFVWCFYIFTYIHVVALLLLLGGIMNVLLETV